MRYLVRCAYCDRAFWLEGWESPAPAHTRWDRRRLMDQIVEDHCRGSAKPGYWIGEGEGSLSDWRGPGSATDGLMGMHEGEPAPTD